MAMDKLLVSKVGPCPPSDLMLIWSSFSVVPSEDAHQSEYVAASDKLPDRTF
jgi:hypothetical protein